MVRDEVRPRLKGDSCLGQVRRRLGDGVREARRRRTGSGGPGEAAWTVWADAACRQDALHRLPAAAAGGRAARQWDHVRLSRLHPRLGEVAKGSHRGSASDGEEPLRQGGGGSHRLVPDHRHQPMPSSMRACGHAAWTLWLLRHHGEQSAAAPVSHQVRGSGSNGCRAAAARVPLGVSRRGPGRTRFPSPDRPSLRCRERTSRVRNRMLEFGTSGSVGGEGGNILAYPAVLQEPRVQLGSGLNAPTKNRPQCRRRCRVAPFHPLQVGAAGGQLGRNKNHLPMSKGLIWLMFHPLQVRQGPMEN